MFRYVTKYFPPQIKNFNTFPSDLVQKKCFIKTVIL